MRLSDLRLSSYGLTTRGLLLLGSLGVIFGALELAIRVVSPVRWEGPYHAGLGDEVEEDLLQRSAVPGLAYELIPGSSVACWGDRIQINQSGMRGADPVENLPDSAVRILALGDDATFGRLVGQDRAFPLVLGQILNGTEYTPGCEFEVLNMGVSGYGIEDALLVFQYRGLALDPDLVVLSYRLDDPESDDLQPMKMRLNGVPWWKHFHLGRMLSQRSLKKAVEERGDGDYFEYLHSEGSPGWKRVKNSFGLLRRLAHRSDGEELPVCIVLMPSLQGVAKWEHYPYSELHDRVSRLAKENRFEVLDLRGPFEQAGKMPGDLTDRANLPNEEGHRLIALAMLRKLADLYPCLLRR